MIFFFIFAITFLLSTTAFWVTFKKDKYRLLPSTFFLTSLNVLFLAFIYVMYIIGIEQDFLIGRILLIIGLLPYAIGVAYGVYVVIISLIINTKTLLKKEGKTVAHFLPLIVAIFLIGHLIFTHVTNQAELPMYIQIWVYMATMMISLYVLQFTKYLIATVLILKSKPPLHQDFIIIHGSGLVNDKVPPLLASRIKKAVFLYDLQKNATGKPPKLICSGGQGRDELRPEGVAMAEFLGELGIPEIDILVEDTSRTTEENLRNSKLMMDEISAGNEYSCIFATSDYHVFRTGLYAKKIGLKVEGVGAKTAKYYLPNGIIREFIAYIVMNKKLYFTGTAVVFIATTILSIIFYFNQ